jgi:arabinofuranan 3-O-arabinosyltransferase
MTSPAATSAAPTPNLPKWFELFLFAFAVANLVWLATALLTGSWLWDEAGRLISTDFLNVYAAGKFALSGAPVSAYDWPTHKALEIQILGYDFKGYYGWHYPPLYLFVAAALATLPYAVAHAGWSAVSFLPFAGAVRASVGNNSGWLIALAAPALVGNVLIGQNGFLTAALIGLALVFLEKRPVLAGICLGLLTYKPHFGILFPVALIAGGHFRAFVAAGVTTIALAGASVAAYGFEPWLAFLRWLPVTSQAFLSEGRAEIEKMQSLFALTRTLGAPEWLAWTLQAMLSGGIAVALWTIWRNRNHAYELKAAALGTGVLLATPYIYLYDMVTITIPIAFLLALGMKRGFLRHELATIAAVMLLVAVFPFVKLPVGFAASLILASLVLRRLFSFGGTLTAVQQE